MSGRVVSTVYYEGSVFIFTEFGYVYEMIKNPVTGVQFRLIAKMPDLA